MRIRIMADFHYSRNGRGESEGEEAFYREYLNRFFEEGPEPDLYVSLGDLTQDGTEDEFRTVYGMIGASRHRAPFIHIPGNHDLLQADAAQTERWGGTTPPVSHGYGAMETDSAVLVFLNTSQARKPLDWGGRLDTAQIELLHRKVIDSGGKPLLVFAHHPLPHTTSMSDIEMMRVEKAAPELEPLLAAAAGPCFWFNGHNHTQSIVRQGAWTYVQTASAVCLPCWREVAVSKEGVTVDTAICSDPALIELAKRALDKFGSFHRVRREEALGEQEDQAVEVRLP